ncbi:F0F1 ATP synthase subunit A [Raineyella sp. LH-20]|uniref:F0F1 ATP synthase subunit A n=1 Tax=Raineyella sp. LH-20 TaxID=3081204 RepID=UPI0029541030|nr:F0F1 ATP synthase subunit A [Raineyella sp. LH-20]WOP20261.1 F0F1 ATP synthase subunit A [Raineyella sp. LH-20]
MVGALVPLEGGHYESPGVKDFRFFCEATAPSATNPGNVAGCTFGIDWMNKPFWQAIIGAALVIVLWFIASRNLKLVPSKGQFFWEYVYNFIRNGVARDILGPEYRRYLPYLLGLFSFLLVNNWFGETFVFMLPTFSNIGYAWALAIMSWVIYIGAGIHKHGFGHYMKMQLIPEGVPVYLYPVIIPLEFLSNFITRPLTLGLRLFANMFAGHLVVMVFVIGGAYLLTLPHNAFYNVSGAVSLIFSFAILFLELFIGFLQAYIFTVLTAQYIHSSLAEAH